jgi:DNA-binding response OmpR family regulator
VTVAKLSGRRVLLVEDELLIAMLLEGALQDQGCTIVGPFSRLADAIGAAQTESLDCALMDINLAGERIFPVAEILRLRSVPFLLLSGYGDSALPDDRQHWPVLSKPFEIRQVMTLLERMLPGHRAQA